jgi:small subunit ribosomal protein S6
MNQHYELTYIVSIKFIDDELQKVNSSVLELLKANKAEITKESVFGKQKLAYPINHIHQGTYMVMEFDLETENLKDVDTKIKLMPEILRHLIIKKKVKTADEIEHEKKMKEKLEVAAQEIEKKEEETVKQKVEASEKAQAKPIEAVKKVEKPAKKDATVKSLDDLDKKLDEILKDDIL